MRGESKVFQTVKVLDRIDLPDNAGSITLYDWMAKEVEDGRNLIRVDPDGRVLWQAEPPLPGKRDCFTSMQWDGKTLTAFTWSSYKVSIDMQDGTVTVLYFEK